MAELPTVNRAVESSNLSAPAWKNGYVLVKGVIEPGKLKDKSY